MPIATSTILVSYWCLQNINYYVVGIIYKFFNGTAENNEKGKKTSEKTSIEKLQTRSTVLNNPFMHNVVKWPNIH